MGFSLNSPSSGAQAFQGATCDDALQALGLTGQQNNFAPETRATVDYRNASMWELGSTENVTITGMKGGIRGRRVTLVNTSGFEIYFSTEDGNSDEANRFNFEATLFEGKGITIQYSGILSRWILVGAGEQATSSLVGASEGTDGDYGGAFISAGRGNAGTQQGGTVMLQGGVSADGQGGDVQILTGVGVAPGSFTVQLGNTGWLAVVDDAGQPSATFTGKLGFFGAAAVAQQSITGATTQDQVDSIVAAGVALGFWTDDR